ncbi:MAG: hypothetical protein QOH97_4277 [Actinoplanes sp.]|jgi:hypothetical protein|nr:hypothetical protein [Actinoplanes sp.]
MRMTTGFRGRQLGVETVGAASLLPATCTGRLPGQWIAARSSRL